MSIDVYAHRGASKNAPENTMSAFKLAYEQGATGIETDIHLTKDRVPILIHDPTINRTTNTTGRVTDYTYEELKQLDAGSWFSKYYVGERICSLEKFLKWIQSKNLHINLELKTHQIDYPDIEDIIYTYIKEFDLFHRTIVSSFNPDTVKRMAKKSNVTTALLHSRWMWNLPSFANEIGADGLHIPYRLLSRRLMKQARLQKLPVRVYTINNKQRVLRCIRHNCDAIFTDIPKDFSHFNQRSL